MVDVRAAGQHPNVIAFKRVVREHESNQFDDGLYSAYTLINGGKHFFDFTEHPYAGLSTHNGGKAAGVAQFIPSTWAEMQQKYGLTGFGPANQEVAFTGCIIKRDALDDVIAGRFDTAVAKCRLEWTSLPHAAESNPTYTMDDARKLFLHWGGTLAGSSVPTQPAAPIEDRSEPYVGGADNSNATTGGSVPFVPIMLSLLPSLLNLFEPRAQATLQKVTGQPADVVQQFAQSLFDKLGQLTGTTDPVQAVAAITKEPDPTKVADLQEHALAYLDKLGPMIDKLAVIDQARWAAEQAGRDAASKRAANDKWDMTQALVYFAGTTTGATVLVLLGAVVWPVLTRDADPNTALLALAGPLFMASIQCWKEIFAYRFDGTKESSATSAALTEMAAQRKA